jgi:hypothetical protein
MEQRKLWLGIIMVGMISTVVLAGGPFGPPKSLLSEGQWSVDAAYFQEEMDLWGYSRHTEHGFENAGTLDDPDWEEEDDSPWGDYNRIRLMDFETSSILGSIGYGLCENLDLFVRLGVADAEASIEFEEEKEVETATGFREIAYMDKINLDFGYGFAWQIGSAFTFCETGSVTWGGRMQFGMSDPDDDSVNRAVVDMEFLDGSELISQQQADFDIDFWQAVAYFGPTWQANDAWSFYGGGGWQVLQATYEASGIDTLYYNDPDGDDGPVYKEVWDESGKIKHASALLVFGGVWTPNVSANVGAEVLIGEGGKWGWGIGGMFPF